ncbi:MAG: phosphoribosyl-AMP cyclohydrolase [Candidatus Omnitrophica bacterium]|nr:phosphoribosyl-AMP cyclohydrolase [Candidatus Omnitrophota bacterium]
MTEFKFDSKGLMPVIIQDADNGEVLMLAYMDKTAVERTLKEKKTVFFSRSRNKYWVKGESSGHIQEVQQALTDCDQDALLVRVRQHGGACHLGFRTCFVHELDDSGAVVRETQKKVFDPDNVYKS